MKRLTILVSLYNSGDWIENRLKNLCGVVNKKDVDIWCLNAASPDERDRNIPKQFDVEYYEEPTRIGVYAAWNRIIARTKSDYITNANSDDLIAPDGYSKMIAYLDRHRVGFVYPSWYTTSTPNLSWRAIIRGESAVADGHPGIYKGDLSKGGVGHFPMWRRSLHQQFGMFDENFKTLGDAEWWARCYHRGTRFHWIREPLACYLWRNGENLWHREVTPAEWELYHSKVNYYQAQA